MLPPQSYDDIRECVARTIFRYEASDIVDVLSHEASIGPIVSSDHCDFLDLQNAIQYVQENKDEDVLSEIHNVLSEYFNQTIDNFMGLPIDIDDNYRMSKEFDENYTWLERNYFEMFGLWSPRILYLYVNDKVKGRKILYTEHESERHTFCPMINNEINMKKCKSCPLCNIIEDNKGSLTYNNRRKTYYCKYLEMLKQDYDEF